MILGSRFGKESMRQHSLTCCLCHVQGQMELGNLRSWLKGKWYGGRISYPLKKLGKTGMDRGHMGRENQCRANQAVLEMEILKKNLRVLKPKVRKS